MSILRTSLTRSVINIRYAQIRSLDLSNGKGVGVALFVQGCHFHCLNCFNPETWDFNGGKEWTEEVKEKFLKLVDRPYIKRISILGGEPLAEENLDGVLDLVNRIRLLMSKKSIWLYTGYVFEDVMSRISYDENGAFFLLENDKKRYQIISQCDVVVDGRYVDEQKDLALKWRGSKNQRVIDIQKSLQKGEIILWAD